MGIWGKSYKFCGPSETTQGTTLLSWRDMWVWIHTLASLHVHPPHQQKIRDLPPGNSLSALSALCTLHTPVAYTEHKDVSLAFLTLGLSSGSPHPFRHSAHPLSHSFGKSEGQSVFFSGFKNTGSDYDLFLLGTSQRSHGWAGRGAEEMQAKWSCPVARRTGCRASSLSFLTLLPGSVPWPLFLLGMTPSNLQSA